MMQQSGEFKQFQKFLSETKGDFHVLEQRVPVEKQLQYFKFSDRLRKEAVPWTENDFEQFESDLYNPESTGEYKRRILSIFAVSKDVKSYRRLERYVQSPDPELTDWAYMALMESRIMLESELSEEKQIYISTGLGGKGRKLRFYLLLQTNGNKPFLDYQRNVIEREFAFAMRNADCDIERLTVHETDADLLALMPIRTDIKQLIEHIIEECNQYGDFLSKSFTVTNVKELNDEEIARIIHGEKNENDTSDKEE